MTNFISLHNQTSYSLLDSIIEPKELFNRAKELGQSAIAVVDHGSLGAAWDSLKASRETGVKLIMGCECYFADDASKIEDKLRHIVFLAKNAIGYRNLLTLNKRGFDQGHFIGKRIYPVVDWKLLEQHTEGLICLTACGNGVINQLLMNKKFEEAEKTLLRLKGIFGDNLGLEVQPNNMKRGGNVFNDEIDQQFLNRRNIDWGKKHGVKVVAACNAHYLRKEDHETHDVLLAIGAHQPIFSNYRLRYPVSDFYVKTGEEVKAFFTRNYGEGVAQQLCDNSVWFAEQCEVPDWIDPKFSNPTGKELPLFPVRDEPDYSEFLQWSVEREELNGLSKDSQYLRFKCFQAYELMKDKILPEKQEEYIKRIETELSVLDYQGFSSYMLIVSDYVNWAKNNNVPVGPGRGSGSGSMIGYLLGIHQADPIKYDLIFERFQTKGKKSAPDLDLDFAAAGRYKVVEYIQKKYGQDYVAHISNFNTITPKIYVKDLARSCEFGGDRDKAIEIGNTIAGIIPRDVKSKKELEHIPLYGEYAKKYPELLKYSNILGKFRNLSTHAAAVVIGRRPLVGLVPIRKDKDGVYSVEYEKNNAEENGLIKMDLLGLSTLDMIEKTNSLIKERGKIVPTINYDDNDEKTYKLITRGDTYGVFQFGTSGGTIELCKKIKPKNIDDLSIITTLARPAAANIRKEFIETREGKRQCVLIHPSLEGAFAKTFGYGLYDESILKLGADVAGWDLNEADRIRKMIKEKGKHPEKDKKLRKEFIDGAVKNNNIREEIATLIWDNEIKKFAGYTFNRAHATTYSMISYHTAYLKAHYPIEFLLANLMAEVNSASPDARPNIDKIKKEMRAHKVKLLPPNLNTSQLTYTISDDKKLLTGLDALKFVGEDAIKDILSKRPFTNLLDFMSRVDSRKVRANNIQALVAAGAMDGFGIPRKLLFLYISDYRKKLQVWLKKHDPTQETFTYPWPEESEWTKSELYALEQFYLGEGFVCKPAEAYGYFFTQDHKCIEDVKRAKDKTKMAPLKAIVRSFFEFKVKRETSKYYGQSMIKAVVEDKNGEQCMLTIFPDRWQMVQDRIKVISSKAVFEEGLAISFGGSTNNYEDDVGIILDSLFDLALPPALPYDLKAKKINIKEAKAKLAEEAKKSGEIKDLLEKIEDDLVDSGLADIDLEYDAEMDDD